MNFIRILNAKEKAEIENKLREQFGIDSILGILVQRGEERIFLFTGSFTESEIKRLEKCTFIERMGVYFAKQIGDSVRLSIEGSQILGPQVKKGIFKINDEDAKQWMMGHELPIQTGEKGFLIMKNKNDFLGTGKASENKIGNFIPKNRRLKEKS